MNFMEFAINEAKIAYNEGNVPVGCVFVSNNKIISKSHNTKNSSNVAIYHAEILGIIEACKFLNSWRLDKCDVYVTLKPCDLCINALAEARVKNVFYLLDSTYYLNNSFTDSKVNLHKLKDDYNYNRLLSKFFNEIRKNN